LVAQRDALVEVVHLYRALGGGWQDLLSPGPETAAKQVAASIEEPRP
jgi:outer membrane protein TolC